MLANQAIGGRMLNAAGQVVAQPTQAQQDALLQQTANAWIAAHWAMVSDPSMRNVIPNWNTNPTTDDERLGEYKTFMAQLPEDQAYILSGGR